MTRHSCDDGTHDEVDYDGDNVTNTFTEEKDLTSYDLYVLTRETTGGTPEPELHVLEGDIKTVENN